MKDRIDGSGNKRKILVVDDDRHLQILYKAELEEDGYDVHIAGSGIEALEKMEKIHPDLVTMDILLPDIDGVHLLRKFKERNFQLPIIISTAYDYRDDFAVWGSEDYLLKSSNLSELKTAIRCTLKKRQQGPAATIHSA